MGSVWYESWFDSPYYELLYQHRDGAEAANFLKALMPHLKLTPQASVWDMACGQGRHAILLKHLGLNVLASDLSKKSIEKARGMFPELDFEVRDMRNCPKQKFEAVFNLFTSIGYFENSQDNQNVFNAAAEALHAHGLFILDFFNAQRVSAAVTEKAEVYMRNGVLFNIKKTIRNNRVIKSIQVTDGALNFDYLESVELFQKHDLCHMADKSGFECIHCFGDYALNPFDIQASPRLILIFKRLHA